MAKTYSYILGNKLYINLTNRCSNACAFCVRNNKQSYYGNSLWLDKEPSVQEVIDSVDFSKSYEEVVFCGFGEPTERIEELVALGKFFKNHGYKTRLNTNGQGNKINGKDIVPMLMCAIDYVNVSLNAPTREEYQKICNSFYGEDAFDYLTLFAIKCKDAGIKIRFSVVDCIGKSAVRRCGEYADSLDIPLIVREFIKDS